MKLDEEMQLQKLSLDITPMIDIVFLLVLFFAVGTSFITPEKLEELRANLAGMITDKTQLAGKLAQLEREYDETVAVGCNPPSSPYLQLADER